MQGGETQQKQFPLKADIVCYYNSSHYPADTGVLLMTLSASQKLICVWWSVSSLFQQKGAKANLVFSLRFVEIKLGALPHMTSDFVLVKTEKWSTEREGAISVIIYWSFIWICHALWKVVWPAGCKPLADQVQDVLAGRDKTLFRERDLPNTSFLFPPDLATRQDSHCICFITVRLYEMLCQWSTESQWCQKYFRNL